MTDFQAVLVSDQKNSAALFGRGLAKKALGDEAGGDTDIATARGVEPLVSGDFWDAELIANP
jgi:hypothetical protein